MVVHQCKGVIHMSDTPMSPTGPNYGNLVSVPISIGEIQQEVKNTIIVTVATQMEQIQSSLNEVKNSVKATATAQMEQIQTSLEATHQVASNAWQAANDTYHAANGAEKAATEASQTAHDDSEANRKQRYIASILSLFGGILVALIALIPSCSRQSPKEPTTTTSAMRQESTEPMKSDALQGRIEEGIAVDGGIYIGEWKDGKRSGKGKIVYDDDSPRDYYEGDWANDKRHGYGKCVYKQGLSKDEVYGPRNYYEGNWQNDDYNGKGKMVFEDGAWYEGDWVESERNGYGILLTIDSGGKKYRYEGLWKNGKRHGYGKMYNVESGGYEACEWNEGNQTKPIYHFDKNDNLWLVNRDDGKWRIDWSTRTISPYQ
jgi:hypothetical protein